MLNKLNYIILPAVYQGLKQNLSHTHTHKHFNIWLLICQPIHQDLFFYLFSVLILYTCIQTPTHLNLFYLAPFVVLC